MYQIFICSSQSLNNKNILTMQKKTRSLLEELDSLYIERDRKLVLENRASNIIQSAIRLLEQIESEYSAEQAENLTRKLLNAIRTRDASKFARSVRRTNVDQ
jgi:F0F1-type ATP synthase membrane subunit b/b'